MNKKIQIILTIILIIKSESILHRRSFSYLNPHKTYITAHRGVNRELPENTYSAFKRAIDFDVDGIELDIWLTKDKIPVVIHGGSNGEISSTMDHSGLVTDFTYDELKQFHTKNGYEVIPSLEDIFKLCKNNIFINIEIKDKRIDEVFNVLIKLIEDYDMNDQIQISSFHYDYYDKVKNYNEKHEKKIEFGFIYSPGAIPELKYNLTTINIHHTDANEDIVKKAHNMGIGVMTWFSMTNVEDTLEYERLVKMGVDIICSNDSLFAKKFRDHYFTFNNVK